MEENWQIGIYGDPYSGDDELVRFGEMAFESKEEAQLLADHLSMLPRYSDYDFEVQDWRKHAPLSSFETVWWRSVDASILDEFDPDPEHRGVDIEASVRRYNMTFESMLICRNPGRSTYCRSTQANWIETDGDEADDARFLEEAVRIADVMAKISDSWIVRHTSN
ncbi:MAG: hypothetical protein KF883_01185 [Thermomicrobiales bacterium]|nr:hypothetical protein [Thermomicrobiales bacterium]